MCAKRRLRSALASAQSDQSLLSAWRSLGSLATHWAHSKDWSDWVDAQAELSLRWVHRSFCHEVAHFSYMSETNCSRQGRFYELGHDKTCSCNMRTTKPQINQHIGAVWSAPIVIRFPDSIIPIHFSPFITLLDITRFWSFSYRCFTKLSLYNMVHL